MSNTTEAASFTSRRGRFLGGRAAVFSTVALMIIVGIASLFLGVYVASRDVKNLRLLVDSLQAEIQKTKNAIVAEQAANASLESRLAGVLAELEKIRPDKDTYVISANQSIVVSDGRLTVGLVGPPSSSKLLLNVNGSQRQAASGDTFAVPVGNTTTCRIAVQRFDLFKAIINVNCGNT